MLLGPILLLVSRVFMKSSISLGIIGGINSVLLKAFKNSLQVLILGLIVFEVSFLEDTKYLIKLSAIFLAKFSTKKVQG